jgi:hypothetical protein
MEHGAHEELDYPVTGDVINFTHFHPLCLKFFRKIKRKNVLGICGKPMPKSMKRNHEAQWGKIKGEEEEICPVSTFSNEKYEWNANISHEKREVALEVVK